MNFQLNQVTRDFLAELEARPDVIGIILFGSWARGNNRPNSDVDLMVLLTDGFKRTVEYRGHQAFEIIYTTPPSALEFWETHRDDCAEFWSIAKILYDKDRMLEHLQAQASQIVEQGKPALDPAQVSHLRFDAEDQLRYLESILDTDPTTANMILTNKVFMLTELFFDVRQRWIPAPKQRLATIKTLNAEFYHLLNSFYSDSISLYDKLSLLQQMIPLVFNSPA